MRFSVVETDNVQRFGLAMRSLMQRGPGVEGMGVLHGRPGEGKSTVIMQAITRTDGVMVRASAAWTMTSMLQTISRELDLPSSHLRQAMIDAIVERLSARPRPLFVDESDYLLRGRGEMLDVLRDIYDLSRSPVVLIGMEEFAKRLLQFGGGRFRRRITKWVEFAGLTLADTHKVMTTLCEVDVDDALVAHLHQCSQANIGKIVIGIQRIESFAAANDLRRVTLDAYGRNRTLFHEDPTFQSVRRAA